ncbi:MAG: HNH endonuclease signature motif containing protein [Candidatus Obscuribacterales bacterium]
MKTTPSMAKNAIKRCIREIVAPAPKDVSAVWLHFDSSCAYCGTVLDRSMRNGHMDHLMPFQETARAGLANLVLACGKCNGDEKLDSDWIEFLRLQCSKQSKDETLYETRRAKIETWIEQNSRSSAEVPPELLLEADRTIEAIFAVFDVAVADLRQKTKQSKQI